MGNTSSSLGAQKNATETVAPPGEANNNNDAIKNLHHQQNSGNKSECPVLHHKIEKKNEHNSVSQSECPVIHNTVKKEQKNKDGLVMTDAKDEINPLNMV